MIIIKVSVQHRKGHNRWSVKEYSIGMNIAAIDVGNGYFVVVVRLNKIAQFNGHHRQVRH